MKTLHWVALASFLASLGTLVGTQSTWDAVLHPSFVGEVIGLLGSFTLALLSGAPTVGSAVGRMSAALQPVTPKE